MTKTTKKQMKITISNFLRMNESGKQLVVGYMIGRIEKFNEEKHSALINELAKKKSA